ncbi:hypothetical protein [Chitinophaga sp. CB10]|uniref:hypothetical protein n=1 Tax=Chitinophaga sp. CB10 TaxID=1891659 RepID=UPI0025C1501D|nr:hypothetical protein [Chitinophaga sp. CB10]
MDTKKKIVATLYPKDRENEVRANKTVNSYKGNLHTFFELLVINKTISENPLKCYKREQADESKRACPDSGCFS